jgi:hypothetical protein
MDCVTVISLGARTLPTSGGPAGFKHGIIWTQTAGFWILSTDADLDRHPHSGWNCGLFYSYTFRRLS